MRQYIINLIRSSKKWQDCIDNGMEELPNLDAESGETVLECYDYYVRGVA